MPRGRLEGGRPGSVTATPEWWRSPQRRRAVEDRGAATEPPALLPVTLHAVAWYAVPLLALVLWTAVAGVRGCAAGAVCGPTPAYAWESLRTGGPQFGAALATSLLVAVPLARIATAWRVASIGLASALIGGGLSTVGWSVLSGQAL